MRVWKLLIFSCIASLCVLSVNAQTDVSSVSLSSTEIVWTTISYELEDNGAIIPTSVDNNTTMEHRFDGYILENEYVSVTLLPEFGGRILSIIYKPTGHEQLYQNPLGLPYGIGDGNFYYDWLMVYGGIFPTFPGPEHGKTWFLPWDFEIITESPEVVTVEMSFVDDIRFDRAPSRFNSQPTGLEARFRVSLHAESRAVDTAITISNPSSETVSYEYWTSITLAPGSMPNDTRVTANTEIIAPIDVVKMPPWWSATIAQEELTDAPDIYTYDNLRIFENWADMGIAYAFPTISHSNFWGVINHDNDEGLIRVADNTISQGLKIWTWGYESANIPIEVYSSDERRPYIELWAGVSPEFFTPAYLAPETEILIKERYVPTVGLSGVTHASDTHLVNFYRVDAETIELQVFTIDAGLASTLIITADDDEVLQEIPVSSDSNIAQSFSVSVPDDVNTISFSLINADEDTILAGNLVAPVE